MKYYLVFILCLLMISGCHSIVDVKSNEDTADEIKIEENHAFKQNSSELKEGILNIIGEDDCKLEVKCLDSDFYSTTDYFSARILEVLERDLEAEWKDSTINNHQLELRYKGYKTILVNTELESYWFEGSDEIFSANGIKELWDRYIVKFIDNKPIYYNFERTLLSKTDNYIDEDKNEYKVSLYYDGDIRLNVGDSEIVIQKNPGTIEGFGNTIQHYSRIPKASAGIEYIRSLGLLMYTYEGIDGSGPYTHVKFYRYSENNIIEVFSSSNIGSDIEVDLIKLDTNRADIKLHAINKSMKLTLTVDEVDVCRKAMSDRSNNINKNRGTIVFNERAILFQDYDNDGELELVISGGFRTYGATSFRIKDKAAFVFKLYPNKIECIEAILDREVGSAGGLFDYFT